MSRQHVLIVGGGLAGMSAGCYALRSGYRVTIVEHNLSLGGVCTAWRRGPYLIDGCIHWLTGGPFAALYDELGVTPSVELRPLTVWQVYQHQGDGLTVPITHDLDALVADLSRLFPEDIDELRRVRSGARELVEMAPPIDAPELLSLRERTRPLWEMRGSLWTLAHFRKPLGEWAAEHLSNPRLRRLFASLVPDTAPAIFLLTVLGYLERGYLSRPVGGTAAFKSALEETYRGLGGELRLHSTVDEVLVRDHRAVGLRLADGTMMEGDAVISTSSAPESVLRLLGGRYEPEPTRERLERWRLFDPIVLVSFGVERRFEGHPSLITLDGLRPVEVGGRVSERVQVRVCNDDPCFAPEGHAVVQALAPTDYAWWAARGDEYHTAKQAAADALLDALEPSFKGLRAAVRAVDVATPLTYWNMARAWRGAYEGWMPTSAAWTSHIGKTLLGLEGFYMAGQWVEPGGGVPMAVMSGRQAVQLLCADHRRAFVARGDGGGEG